MKQVHTHTGISVVIPCYNSAETIEETLQSVLAQTIPHVEIIVVDDGSEDSTRQLVEAYADRVAYLYQQNQGQAAARNTGIRAAHGEFLAFVDSDDLWLPDKLEQQLLQMRRDQRLWCYCDCLNFQNDGTILGRYNDLFYPARAGLVLESLLMGNFIASATPLIHYSLFEYCGLFDESSAIRSREDWEMWLRIAAQYPVSYVPLALAKHRVHERSITYGEDVQTAYGSHLAVLEKLARLYPQRLSALLPRATAHYAARFSKTLWLRGEEQAARHLLQQALQRMPGKISYRMLQVLYALPGRAMRKGLALWKKWRR